MLRNVSLALFVCLCFSANAVGDSVFFNGTLDANSPTFDAPGASALGSGLQYFAAQQFSVDLNGQYTFESSSPNTAGAVSNALDTFLVLYANSFDPNSPAGQLAFDDDFTGLFSVLPGPYAGTISGTATGFQGAQPGSQILGFALTAGTQYYLINTSFRDTTYVTSSSSGASIGDYYTGINGPGNITLAGIPEPSTIAILGMMGLVVGFRRRRS